MVAAERIEPDPEPVDLGLALVKAGCLSEADHKRVLRMQAAQPEAGSLVNLLNRLGLVAERDIAAELAQLLDLPLIAGEDFPAEPLLAERLSFRFLKECRALPLELVDGELRVAMADPQDAFVLAALRLASGCRISPRVALGSEIDAAIERMHGQGQSQMGGILARVESNEQDEVADVEQLRDRASEAPVIRLVNLIIQRAVELRASDIHIEPFESRLKVRYRIDGLLQETEAPPVQLSPAVISRVKLMARLNIAERRLPQDGRIEMRVQGSDLDIRVSTVPTMHGESVVMRLLNRENVVLDFAALGFGEQPLARLQAALRIPHGVLLVTGPTGSGKTTTLYTALNSLNTSESKLITVEDPVEYQLEGVNQIQVKPSIGLTFASALRSIVRQDPDVIMVGEMRDLETARICIQSALTGHLVLSTLHTNDAPSSITRLLEMGVEDYLLTSTLNGVLAQRLVRKLCHACREPYEPLAEMVSELNLARFAGGRPVRLYRARGCKACNGSGYHGRIAIIEVLVLSDAVRRLILQHADAGQLLQAARGEGMLTMYEDGCQKAVDGQTTLEEVIRVTQEG
ncbi:type II secretion system ATPase GspE [Pseudomonas sp. L-22-4S-12]|uniref:type II secretion system ATPase GspE n=1 Tax=Pseudomonas sp. L-22-4S-12 TaxID=2610893 RepID=UPI0013298B28|nr:type II secretion system ATPase GspE [Pseudomonas sp. L-22-4S-12]MWV14700.1 type II secretion system ATPase GspE [Pseudomonas sp. L-22-4S-12]